MIGAEMGEGKPGSVLQCLRPVPKETRPSHMSARDAAEYFQPTE
jgi:hypothetical protein